MEQIKIDIKVIGDNLKEALDETIIANAIVVENFGIYNRAFEVTISGRYNRTYTIVSEWTEITLKSILIEKDLLIIILSYSIAVIDLNQNRLLQLIKLDSSLFSIHRFKSGYFIYGELLNYFLNQKFEVVWDNGCADIFVNPKVEKELEIFSDYITVFDWCGYKHYYNENGKFKTEHYPKYEM